MIIWANRMYPKNMPMLTEQHELPYAVMAASHTALPQENPAAPRVVQEHDPQAGGTVYVAGDTVSHAYDNRAFSEQTAVQHTEDNAFYKSAVYAPHSVSSVAEKRVVLPGSQREIREKREVAVPVPREGYRAASLPQEVRSERGKNGQTVTYHTTVQVEMKNYNQIHGEQDMVHLAETLSDALYAALQSGAEGVGH